MKKLKVGDKVKIPSLKSLVEMASNGDFSIYVSNDSVEICGQNDITLPSNVIGKAITVESINETGLGDHEICFEDYFTLEVSPYNDELHLLTGIDYKIGRDCTKSFKKGDLLDGHPVTLYDDGSIQAGCEKLSESQVTKLFKELGKHLGYTVEG